MRPPYLFALVGAATVTACGDDVSNGPVGANGDNGGLDAGVTDAASGPDGSGPSDDAGPPDAAADAGTELVAVPFPDLEPFVIDAWRVAFVSAQGNDPGFIPFLRDEIPYPEELGTDALGLRWQLRALSENGEPPPNGVGTYYLAAAVEVDETVRLVAQLDSLDLAVDGFRIPGDPYRSGRHRLPVVLEPGRHVLVARGTSFRGLPRLRLWRTPAPFHPNLADVTRPDLLAGSTVPLPFGVHLVNLSGAPLDLSARVAEGPQFEASEVQNADLPPGAATQVSFELRPKPGLDPALTDTATATLVFDAPGLETPYSVDVGLPVVDGTRPYRKTRRSGIDRSTQYHAIHPPSDFDPDRSYALALSLHGASVEAIGQARAYGQKDWIFLVAPTNRRPFGFDWQDWGRLDAIESLDDALDTLPIDPTQVHLTGHSMGGHGSWHLGVLHSNRFATVGPSAGWVSFFTLGTQPTGIAGLERARAHSYTRRYYENLEDEAVYIIHGSADDNIPVGQSRDAYAALQGVVPDLVYHEEAGAGHWWDNDRDTPGAACVDWAPLFETMERRRLDPSAIEFAFRSPNPSVRADYGYLEVLAAEDPYADFFVSSRLEGGTLTVTSTNVRALELDGDALLGEGVETVVVDGETVEVEAGPIAVGATEKRPGRYGPFKEVLFEPFCFVYADSSPTYRELAANLSSTWSILGNGRSCAVPLSEVDQVEVANRIYLGVPSADLPLPADYPFAWDAASVNLGRGPESPAAMASIFPEGDGLSAAIFATGGDEWMAELLFEVQPIFSSRTGIPDYISLVSQNGQLFYGPLGFFDADWNALPPR